MTNDIVPFIARFGETLGPQSLLPTRYDPRTQMCWVRIRGAWVRAMDVAAGPGTTRITKVQRETTDDE